MYLFFSHFYGKATIEIAIAADNAFWRIYNEIILMNTNVITVNVLSFQYHAMNC